MLHQIFWPEGFVPGMTDNFASNEIIVPGLTAQDVWPYIVNTALWPKYYNNASHIEIENGEDSKLFEGARFRFVTFGLKVEARVNEFIPPTATEPGRIAWNGWVEGDERSYLEVHHAWLFENLPGNRLRMLTQETQNGLPAMEMAVTKPNPMINAHQDWLEGLASAAKEKLV